MERKVARARGETTFEEKKDLENEIARMEEQYSKAQSEYISINSSLK